jgi:small ligand-binding sensory domain FIST
MAGFYLPIWWPRRQAAPWCRTALVTDASLQGAVEAVALQLRGCGPADLALVFASASYASDLPRLLPLLRQKLNAKHWLGCLSSGVVGTGADGVPHELEQAPGLSVTLLHLPGARLHPFVIDSGPLPDLDGPAQPWLDQLGGSGNGELSAQLAASRSMLLLLDPTCPTIGDLISGLDFACPRAHKVGGIAGQHSAPHGSLLFDDQVRSGAIGCLIDGDWALEPVVAQGCRPIGPVLEVEQAQRNVVLEVSEGNGRRNSPVAALQEILSGLSAADRDLVKNSLFLGVARRNFSLAAMGGQAPSAFLVRNLIGVDPRNGAVAVGERMRVGQQVQFQLRDGDTSRQELRELLRSQARSNKAPLVGLLFACLGRGKGLYGEPDGDVNSCAAVYPGLPIAGAFCNGEIGPVAGTTHLHGYTACWGLLVPSRQEGKAQEGERAAGEPPDQDRPDRPQANNRPSGN